MTEFPVLKSSFESGRSLIIESIATYDISVTAELGDFHVSGLAIIDLVGANNGKFKVRTLLDSGAGTNFICEKLLPHLKHELIATQSMKIAGINSTICQSSKLVRIFLNHEICPLQYVKCFTIPSLLSYNIDKAAFKTFIQNCQGLTNIINPLNAVVDHNDGLGMIIGPGTIRDICHKPPSYIGNYLVEHTYFGPSISGRLNPSQPINSYTSNLDKILNKVADQDELYFQVDRALSDKLDLLENLEFLHDKEILGVKSEELHLEDEICINKFKQNFSYDSANKRYTVGLPFNHNIKKLPSNKAAAFRRAQALQKTFFLDPEFGVLYAQQLQNMQKADFIEEVTQETEVGTYIHYLPHRGVKKKDSKTTSLRIVMDAACRANEAKLSLNDCLYTGPNLIVSMLYLLLKFCKHRYGITGDIEKAFLQLQIRKEDRDVMRFFFPQDINDPSSKMKTFRYRVLMFGASSSPYLLAAVIQVHLEQHVKDRTMQESLKQIFFDNLIVSKLTETETITLYHEARRIFLDMGLSLRQWASNSQELTSIVKSDGLGDESDKIKLLGYYWDPIQDTISFKTEITVYHKYTKRFVLKFGNQIMDLLGIILPVEMRFRTFLTKLWHEKYTWDQSFAHNAELVKEWDTIVYNIMQALKCTFPRTMESYISIELHIFSDASFEAYGTVAYFVVPQCHRFPEGLSQVRLAKGKTVARKKRPKIDTIPKLELMGILMSANAAANILEAYSNIIFHKKVLWSDSQTALGQCQVLVNKSHFVHNRVVSIRGICQGFELRYVATDVNPADLITRTFKLEEEFLNKDLWWKGPSWITNSSEWGKSESYNLHPKDWEQKTKEWSTSINFVQIDIVNSMVGVIEADVPGVVVDNQQDESSTPLTENQIKKLLWKWGNYKKLIKFFTCLHQIKTFFLSKKTHKSNHRFSANDLAAGEREAILTMQRESFPDELELLKENKRAIGDKGQYAQLKLYLDTKGIIRLHGRINEESLAGVNRPILYAYRHPLTIAYILHKHKHFNCSSTSYSLNIIRREIHSLKLRRQIHDLVRKSVICKKLHGRPFKFPEHPPLNDYRTRCTRPFSMVGLDYIGPFTRKTSKANADKGNDKVYIILFSCLVSRAIYLVLVTDRKTETFLRALRELSARHTEPKMFISDNEGSFQASEKVLFKISQRLEMIAALREKNIEWKFIPSRASWMGGVYERLVQIIKKELDKMQRSTKFSIQEWRSHLHEVEAIVNDRPLTYVSDIGSEPEVITPKAILHGCRSDSTLATDLNIDEAIIDMKQHQNQPEELYKKKLELKNNFWRQLTDQYTTLLRSAKYKKSNSQGRYSNYTPKVGSVVSIYEPDSKLGGRLAYITRLIPSEDGIVRKAEVKVTIPSKVQLHKNFKTELREKSINHLLPLELNFDEDIESLSNLQNEDNPDLSMDQETIENMPDAFRPILYDERPSTSRETTSTDPVLIEPDAPCQHSNCLNPIPDPGITQKWIKCGRKDCPDWHHLECAGLDTDKDMNYYEQTFYACQDCWAPYPESSYTMEIREVQITGRPIRKTANKARLNWLKLKEQKLIGS